MTVLEKGQLKVKIPSPNGHRPGTSKSDTRRESRSLDGKGKSGRRDTDLISTATSALRRLNFRSAGRSHAKRVPSSAPAGQNSSPSQQSSSTASETTINTSTESSNTVYTTMTATDAEQEERNDHDLLESRPLWRDERALVNPRESFESIDYSRQSDEKNEIFDEFDELFYRNEVRISFERSLDKPNKYPKGIAAAGGVGDNIKGSIDQKSKMTTVKIQDGTDKGKFKKFQWPLKGKQISFADDKHMKSTKTGEGYYRGPSMERNMQQYAHGVGASPPTSMFPQDQAYFLTPSMIDEDAVQDYDFKSESEEFQEMERPKTNIKTIQSEPQRTFSSNFNKRKKVDAGERRQSQAEFDRMPYSYSPTTSSKARMRDDNQYQFPPRTQTRSDSPDFRRQPSTSGRKLPETPGSPKNYRSGWKTATHTAVAPFTLSNVQFHDKEISEDVKRYRSDFGSAFDVSSSSAEPRDTSSSNRGTNTSGSNMTLPNDDYEEQFNRNYTIAYNIRDDGNAMADETTRMGYKRKMRYDRKSTSLEPSDAKFTQSRNSRDAFLNSFGERNAGQQQSRKYSVLTTDGSVKNFVNETSAEFQKSGKNINKENIKKKKTGKKSSDYPQRQRRVSIIQGESTRHFIFEEPDTSRMKPSKQRKVSKVIEDNTRSLLLEDVHPRKSSLAPGDTMKMGDESPRKSSSAPDEKPRKFSINTLGDIVSARKFSLLPPGEIYTSQIDGKTTEVIKLAPVSKGKPLATIVVQQASIQRGSISGPSNQKDESDSLPDVSNSFTLEELHEFDMKYGSPHHSRSQSVKTPGRSSGRTNYLCLPQQRARVASMPNTGVEEEYYRLRHFSITGKGLVNRGDSLKSRRSRSNTSVASSNSNSSTDYLANNACAVGSYPGTARNSAECSLASSRDSSTTSVPYRVVIVGSEEVGKTALIMQFMTSEYVNTYEASLDEEEEEKTVAVLLDEEESEVTLVDYPSSELVAGNYNIHCDAHGFMIVYSVVDRRSFQIAEQMLQFLWRNESIGTKAVILVANKDDLARSRTITYLEGVDMAKAYDCKYIETSVGMGHNVDELLVGIISQIRLLNGKSAKSKKKRKDHSPKKWRNTRFSASLKVKDDDNDNDNDNDDNDHQSELTSEQVEQCKTYQREWLGMSSNEIENDENHALDSTDSNDPNEYDTENDTDCASTFPIPNYRELKKEGKKISVQRKQN